MTKANELESALKRATNEPGFRPLFYQRLLKSQLFVLAEAPRNTEPTLLNYRIVAWVRTDGANIIPCFTTMKKAKSAALEHHIAYKVSVRGLLETNLDCGIHLNPTFAYHLQLSVDDVASLLTRGTVNQGIEFITMDKERIICAAQETPSELLEALSALFCHCPDLDEAYLLEVTVSSTNYRALVIGLNGAVSETIVHAIATVIPDAYSGSLPIDVCQVHEGTPELEAIKRLSIRPFYVPK